MSAHHAHLSPTQRLRGWLRAESTQLWVALIYSIAIGLLSLVVPITVQSVVNTIAFGTVLQPLFVLTLAVLAGLGFSAVLQAMRTYVVEMMQRRIFVRVATNSLSRLLRARVDAFDAHHGPELVNRFLDVVTVQKAGAILLIDGLTIFMQTVMGMLLLAVYHPWLLVFDLVLLLCIVVILFPMGRGAIGTSVRESQAKYALVAWLEEIARWQATFKSTRGSSYAVERTDSMVREYLRHRAEHFRILLRQISASLLLHALASSALLGVGGLLVIDRQLTLGQLIAAELVVTVVVSGFAKFGKQLETFYDLAAAVDKLGYLTDLPLEAKGGESLPALERGARIRLCDISFSYANGRTVLSGVNLDLLPGARVGLTGYGKSTLLDVIYGLRTPSGGTIEVDGHDLREVRLDHLRSQIALVRAPEIFNGTVADNVRLGNSNASTAEIRRGLEVAGLLADIQSLPEATQTELQTGGLPLSPSQGIRLMLARSILQTPRVLLVDEALDQVETADARVELARALFRELPGATTIVVSSKPEILALCDAVYDLRNSRLERTSELIAQ